jgi:hypothetical protein
MATPETLAAAQSVACKICRKNGFNTNAPGQRVNPPMNAGCQPRQSEHDAPGLQETLASDTVFLYSTMKFN